MPKKKYDLNDNGKIDPDEREIMLEDRRRIMIDADAKRDAQRRMAWFSLTGMLRRSVPSLSEAKTSNVIKK